MSLPIYFAISSDELEKIENPDSNYACLGYHLDPFEPRLLGPQSAPKTPTLMLLSDNIALEYTPDDAVAKHLTTYAAETHTGIVCDFETPYSQLWQDFIVCLARACEDIELPLWIPEKYAEGCEHAFVMIGSDVSGGSFQAYLEHAAKKFPERAVLELRPISERFQLPCSDCQSIPLRPDERVLLASEHSENTFFSPALCCQYFSSLENGQLYITLFDTQESLEAKCHIAEHVGFRAAIGLHQELTSIP